jgi:hypothetical protein
MLNKLIKFLFKPRGYFDRLSVSLIVNVFCRQDFHEILQLRMNNQILAKDLIVTNVRELCYLFFSLCNDNTLVVIQDHSKKQVEYTLITELSLPNTVKTNLYKHLPDGMIVYFSHREKVYYI